MLTNRFISLFDYFFVLRPILFLPGWSTMLAGYLIATKEDLYFSSAQFLGLDYLEIGLLFLIFASAMGASFLLNQLEDIESDLKNKKLFFLTENHISKSAAKKETIILIILALGLAYIVSISVLILIIFFLLITGYAYNYKPFLLKDKPFGSLLANSLMGFLAFALGWVMAKPLGLSIFIDSIPYLFLNTSLYFFTTLPDVPGDLNSGKRTLAVLHGTRFVINLGLLTYLLSLVFAVYLQDWFALLFIVLSLPFYIYLFTKKEVNATIKTTKYAILFLLL